jgi:Tol biopolymer transport system component
MDSDGSNVEQLTEALVLKSGLSWSDDGQRMLFEGSGDIYVVGVETKELSILISDAASNEATPGWAQSGKSVVFSSDRSQNWELYMLSLDEPGSRTLYRVTDDPGVDRSPAWSACSQ